MEEKYLHVAVIVTRGDELFITEQNPDKMVDKLRVHLQEQNQPTFNVKNIYRISTEGRFNEMSLVVEDWMVKLVPKTGADVMTGAHEHVGDRGRYFKNPDAGPESEPTDYDQPVPKQPKRKPIPKESRGKSMKAATNELETAMKDILNVAGVPNMDELNKIASTMPLGVPGVVNKFKGGLR